MVNRDYIVDPDQFNFGNVIADQNEIRRHNRQRFEMELLTAVIYLDHEQAIAVGYKDLDESEFWVRGHMPGYPLMPGVLMCEAAAQLCSFVAHKLQLLGDCIVGLGGLDTVRFRGPVYPGNRFIVACQKLRLRPNRMITCRFQGIVQRDVVCEGQMIGIPLPVDSLSPSPCDPSNSTTE